MKQGFEDDSDIVQEMLEEEDLEEIVQARASAMTNVNQQVENF